MEDADRTVKLGFSPGHLDAKIECPKCKGHMGVCVSFEDWELFAKEGKELVALRKTVAEAREALGWAEDADKQGAAALEKALNERDEHEQHNVMLALTIADAAELLIDWATEQGCSCDPKVTAWLARPEVVAARKK